MLDLRLVSDDGRTVTVEHDPVDVPGLVGFRLAPVVRDGAIVKGAWAHTWDTGRTRHKFASGHGPYTVQAMVSADTGTYPSPPAPPSAAPVWNADLETGDLSQYGGWEFGGTFDGTPNLHERVQVLRSDGNVRPIQGDSMLKLTVKPGDQYGGSSGWRTLARQYEPLRTIPVGTDHWYVWAMLLPPGYPGAGTNPWQTGPEMHQTKAPYVAVPGSAPFHLVAYPDRFYVDVKGGRDGSTVRHVNLSFAQGYARNAWYVFVMRYKHGVFPDGAFELYYARQGEPLQNVVALDGIGTVYEQTVNYFMFGLYRDQVGSQDTVAYFDAVREYARREDAFAFAQSVLLA